TRTATPATTTSSIIRSPATTHCSRSCAPSATSIVTAMPRKGEVTDMVNPAARGTTEADDLTRRSRGRDRADRGVRVLGERAQHWREGGVVVVGHVLGHDARGVGGGVAAPRELGDHRDLVLAAQPVVVDGVEQQRAGHHGALVLAVEPGLDRREVRLAIA